MTITWPFRITFPRLIFNYEIALSPIESAHNLRKLKVKMRSFCTLLDEEWIQCLLFFGSANHCEKNWTRVLLLAYEEKKRKKFFFSGLLNDVSVLLLFWLPSLDTSLVLFIVCLWFYLFDYFPFKTELKKYAFGTGLQRCQSEGKQL